MVTRTLSCRGALTVHKDLSVDCSETTCLKSRSSESALATHAFIVVCHSTQCSRCAPKSEHVRGAL